MKEFLKRAFASLVGTTIAIFGLVCAAFLVLALVATMAGGVDVEDGSWLVIDLRDGLLAYDPPAGVLSEVTGGDQETLQRVLDSLAKAEADERIEGVVLRVAGSAGLGGGKVFELREAIGRLRGSGKRVLAYADVLDRGAVWLVGACEEVCMPPTGYVSFHGVNATSTHVLGTLEKLGIRPNVHKIKDYKSAAELVTRRDLSEPAKENRRWLIDEMWQMALADLEADRGITEGGALELMEHALFTVAEAVDGGLVDRAIYWDELAAELAGGDADDFESIANGCYSGVTFDELDIGGDKTIAVVHAQGLIAGRETRVDPLLGLMIGWESVVRDLERARKDDDVVAVVLRIDSGGGEALASDMMGHEVDRVSEEKPIVASMVDVAASGGYHMAYRATKIVASPSTITGSIGSINGKFDISEFHEKLGITHDSISKGPMATIHSAYESFTPEQRARWEENHWNGFNDWLRDVAEHRGMTFEEAETLAHGRVWSGRQAKENGLIDELGGLDRAIDLAKELAEIAADEAVSVDHYPVKKDLVETLMAQGEPADAVLRWTLYRMIHEDLAESYAFLTSPALLLTDPVVIE